MSKDEISLLNTIETHAWVAVHTVICLMSKRCADTWSEGSLIKARNLLTNMHVDRPEDLDLLRKMMIALRKSGKTPPVIAPAKGGSK